MAVCPFSVLTVRQRDLNCSAYFVPIHLARRRRPIMVVSCANLAWSNGNAVFTIIMIVPHSLHASLVFRA